MRHRTDRLRHEVERIRSVPRLMNPEYPPGRSRECGFMRSVELRLVGRRGDGGRGDVGHVVVFLIVFALVLGVLIFGQGPRGEVGVV